MFARDDYTTRRAIRERTGWSLTFIDKRLPRIKIGGKVLIPVAAFERLLNGETAR